MHVTNLLKQNLSKKFLSSHLLWKIIKTLINILTETRIMLTASKIKLFLTKWKINLKIISPKNHSNISIKKHPKNIKKTKTISMNLKNFNKILYDKKKHKKMQSFIKNKLSRLNQNITKEKSGFLTQPL